MQNPRWKLDDDARVAYRFDSLQSALNFLDPTLPKRSQPMTFVWDKDVPPNVWSSELVPLLTLRVPSKDSPNDIGHHRPAWEIPRFSGGFQKLPKRQNS